MQQKLLYIFSLFLFLNQLKAQTDTHITVSNSTLVSTENQPLWLWANHDGKIRYGNRFLNLTDIGFSGLNYSKDSTSFLIAGTDLVAGLGDRTQYLQANEIFAGINLKNWEIKGGLWVNEMQLGGLSTSNGNIAQSRNARPHPRISFRVSDYKPLPWIGKRLLFKGEYEEGWLNDNRYVKNTHLHHKSLYLKLKINKNFDLQGGLEHFVMWGGTSQNSTVGKMPDDFNAYLKYITGQSGDSKFPTTDQRNVAGNQFGTYQARITYRFTEWEVMLNLSHPFDDLSGMNWRNWTDNLISIYLTSKDRDRLITDFIYEFTDTHNQSARSDTLYYWHEGSQTWRKEEYDDYFNHGIYRSGATYQQMAMVSPLFFPVIINNGISYGFESTRFFAHHIGAKGKLNPELAWKGMATFIQHLGTYQNRFTPRKEQLSCYFQIMYISSKLPFEIAIEVAGDKIKTEKDKLGAQLTLRKIW